MTRPPSLRRTCLYHAIAAVGIGAAPAALAGAPVTEVVTGEDFTCTRSAQGAVHCWGNNEDRQLGVERTTKRSDVPVDTRLTGVVALAASAVQACAVGQSGDLRCWGQIDQPAWGSGKLPTISPLSSDIAGVSVGPGRGCARHRGGSVSCWDATPVDDDLAQSIDGLSEIEQVAVGASHACARNSAGDVWCWGDDRKGQLGNERPGWPSTVALVPGLTAVVDLSAGEDVTCAVRTDGTAWCWGPNVDGNLGIGSGEPTWGPQQVQGLPQVVEVAVGRRDVCARSTTGRVWCWGADPCPRPDAPTRRLAPVDQGLSGVTALSGGGVTDHHCAIVEGKPVCWGFNSHGQAGDPAERCVALPK